MTTEQKIIHASNIIKLGGLVVFPTETVYGLGANALNPVAVAKIFEVKERPSFDPLIVHIASIDSIEKLTIKYDDRVYKLAERFWPGPLTIVLPKSKIVPDIVTSGLNSVGIRIPNNAIALDLIKYSECPIAAPSANKFGQLSPTKIEHAKKQLKKIDYFLDGGSTAVGIESTVIALQKDGFIILRQGVITQSDLETVLPKSKQTGSKQKKIISPGSLKSHYSPTKPIYILGENNLPVISERTGFISFGDKDYSEYKMVESLSKNSDLNEAAINLFSILHRMEEAEIDYIIVEPVPEHGVGIAIMDRLRKAAYKYL